MNGNGLSAGDILALTKENGGNFLEGNGILIILFFLVFFGGFGNARNDNIYQVPATKDYVSQQFNTQNLTNKLDSMSNGIGNATWNLNNELHNLGSKIDNCCCQTQKELIENRYAAERNTCAIIERINALENSHKDEVISQLTSKNNINETVMQIANLQGRYVTNPPCPPIGCSPCGNLYA